MTVNNNLVTLAYDSVVVNGTVHKFPNAAIARQQYAKLLRYRPLNWK